MLFLPFIFLWRFAISTVYVIFGRGQAIGRVMARASHRVLRLDVDRATQPPARLIEQATRRRRNAGVTSIIALFATVGMQVLLAADESLPVTAAILSDPAVWIIAALVVLQLSDLVLMGIRIELGAYGFNTFEAKELIRFVNPLNAPPTSGLRVGPAWTPAPNADPIGVRTLG